MLPLGSGLPAGLSGTLVEADGATTALDGEEVPDGELHAARAATRANARSSRLNMSHPPYGHRTMAGGFMGSAGAPAARD